jgi:hypothetical protein
MRTVFRLGATLVSAIATLYFVFWVGGALLLRTGAPFWVALVISVVAACSVAWFTWRQTASAKPGLIKAIMLGAVIIGGIAFLAGFFGPIIFMPGANQGPLLGIFITGPLGFLVGAIGGAVFWIVRRRRESRTAEGGVV